MANRSQKKPDRSKLIGIAFVLLLTAPQFIIPIVIGWAIVQTVKKASANADTPTQRSAPQEKFDDCPQPLFCFHKDKGEHHVRKGREIDPWDRPDIDISKYQRKN